MNVPNQCPRCRAGRLRSWQELTAEEREVVKRLPASADYDARQRQARHRWCNQCWYEDKGRESQTA